MSSLLESIAVARRYEEEAAEILGAYINTQPQMAYNYSLETAPVPQAAAAAPAGPGSSGAPRKAATQQTREQPPEEDSAQEEDSGEEVK